ncbi:MAG: hypothetical protein ACOYN8_05310 [Pseudanabaena sp.]|jgi:hypothetical protein
MPVKIMQSDAFPNPPIYAHQFQPLIAHHLEPKADLAQRDRNFNYLLNEVALLMTDCSMIESEFFWKTTDYLKVKLKPYGGLKNH